MRSNGLRSAAVPQLQPRSPASPYPHSGSSGIPAADAFTVDILSVADVLQVASRVLSAQLRVGLVRLQPGVRLSPQLGARRHTAGRRVAHLSLSFLGRLRLCLLRAGTASRGAGAAKGERRRASARFEVGLQLQ